MRKRNHRKIPRRNTMLFNQFKSDLSEEINGSEILVTGGSGSFGRKFIETILSQYNPKRVVIFSRDEHKQHEMMHSMRKHLKKLRFFIGDVRDADRLSMAFRGIDYVIHAAALKHVTVAEYNPFECIKTNVIGAENVVQASIRNNVKKVIALSTDKACNPTNLYGASKLASDKIFVAAGNVTGNQKTLFSVVRYGNVFNSRGSVVPLYKNLIDQGATEIPITDARMTRFWITLEQGVNFVLSSMKEARGGEIFVPKIPSMRIVDLARALAPDLNFKIIGVRPGEKLHEVMISIDDARNTVELSDRYIIEPNHPFWTRKRKSHPDGVRVDEDFTYVSGNNSDWINSEDLKRLIKFGSI